MARTGILQEKIFDVGENSFDDLALDIFQYQARENETYKKYLQLIKVDPLQIRSIEAIPFMPIDLFKYHKVITGSKEAEVIFTSSGTTGRQHSSHFVSDPEIYIKSFTTCFEIFYCSPAGHSFFILLPSYLERSDSSLIYMCRYLAEHGENNFSDFYLYDHERLYNNLMKALEKGKNIFLLGVSFALLDLAEKYTPDLSNAIIMETGGMKGRRKEMIREELHGILSKAFNVKNIHSEYGMTELLSQAYSQGDGIYYTPPWMKVLIRDVNDPFDILEAGKSGAVNVIDLANINSCCFIATSDLGKRYSNNTFSILGRIDNSDIRGCNLLL